MRKLLDVFSFVVLLAMASTKGTWGQETKVYDLGNYPGGSWAELHGINDFGVAIGLGDVPTGTGTETQMIGVSLFGGRSGQWFASGVSSSGAGGISNTGIIVGSILGSNGYPEAYAWMPNHAGFHLGTLPGDDSSSATAINHWGTLIVGASGRHDQNGVSIGSSAVVWTQKLEWNNGRPTMAWEIHALASAAGPDVTLSYLGGYGVNDLQQIVGEGYQYEPALDEWQEIAVVWSPIKYGREWEIQRLPMGADFANGEALSINNLGEIVGDVWGSTTFPALWKKELRNERSWSLTQLPTPSGLPNGCVARGVNELGDVVGNCTDGLFVIPARWSTHDLGFVELLGFPGYSGIAYGVNNLGIAVGEYQVVYTKGRGNPFLRPEQAVAVKLH